MRVLSYLHERLLMGGAVLGSEECQPRGVGSAPRTMLYDGRPVSPSRRRNGRTPHPNIQPHQPHNCIQGACVDVQRCFADAGQTITSPLKWQTRVVSCFTNSPSSGFAVGSIEGRVAIQCVFADHRHPVADTAFLDTSKKRTARRSPWFRTGTSDINGV